MVKINRLGVIDIGTLKIKFQIVEIGTNGQVTTVYTSSTLTCLGLRLAENGGQPEPKNLRATVAELKRCKKILAKEKVQKIKVVSTHALREMGKVGEKIAQKINKEVGFHVEIISQNEEARLFFNAAMLDFETDEDHVLVDVGGGSVQILIGNRHQLKNSYLFKVGTVSLSDHFVGRHQGTDAPTAEEIDQARKHLQKIFAPLNFSNAPIIYGSSCIIDVFECLKLNLASFRKSKAHPYKVDLPQMEKFLAMVAPMPYDDREKKFNFSQKYFMWGIDMAFLVITELGKKIHAPYVIPSNANINQGLIQSLI